jgi:DNA-binding HxlR family transcriptional regulator
MDDPADLLGDRSTWTIDRCSIASALDVVGNRVALLLLREAFLGTRRFDDFAVRAGVSEPTAARRLADLTEAGLLTRVPYREPGQRVRHEYELTPQGRDMQPVLTALRDWGDRWASGEDGPPLHAVHTTCGTPVRAVLRCERDHHVRSGETALYRGPAPSYETP